VVMAREEPGVDPGEEEVEAESGRMPARNPPNP
jgi:hypothetical protein